METKKKHWWETYWWVWVFFLPTLTVFGYLLFIYSKIGPFQVYSIANAGLLGDSFGILTSWFSGMAFCAAIYLLRVQKKEFDDIRKHSLMMSKIERASFQPIFKISGQYNSQRSDNERKLEISVDANSGPSFFIFERLSFVELVDEKEYIVDFSGPNFSKFKIGINLNVPVDRKCKLLFEYKDLSGYVTVVTFFIDTKAVQGNNPEKDIHAYTYDSSRVENIEMTTRQ